MEAIDIKHWNFYSLLEQDFLKTTQYVYLSEDNYKTYSIEYSRLILSICAEFEIMVNELCKLNNVNKERMNILDYKVALSKIYVNELYNIAIDVNSQFHIRPLEDWNAANKPKWWDVYNRIKHNRYTNYKKATLKNCLYSLAALYVIQRLWILKKGEFISKSNLFETHLNPRRLDNHHLFDRKFSSLLR